MQFINSTDFRLSVCFTVMLNPSGLCNVCCRQCYQRFGGIYCFHPQCRNELGGWVFVYTGRTADKKKVILSPIGRTKHQPPPIASYICWTKPNIHIHTLLTQTLKVEETCSTETSGFPQATWRYNEDSTLHSYRREKLKFIPSPVSSKTYILHQTTVACITQ